MPDPEENTTTEDSPREPTSDKSWLELENVRGDTEPDAAHAPPGRFG